MVHIIRPLNVSSVPCRVIATRSVKYRVKRMIPCRKWPRYICPAPGNASERVGAKRKCIAFTAGSPWSGNKPYTHYSFINITVSPD